MAESKMPARIWAYHGGVAVYTAENPANGYFHEYRRTDLVEPLVEALRASQAALAMMTAPKSIMATSTAQAYAHAYAAECKARAALSSWEAAQ
jgi:hypothetical protein